MRGFGAVVMCLMLAPLAHAKTDRGLKDMEKAARKAGAAVSRPLFGKVCVLDFTDLASPDTSSEFGQKAAELVTVRLVERAGGRYQVVERRSLMEIAKDSLLVFGDDSEVFQRIRKEAGADVFVFGTYTVSESEISIDAKATDAKTLKVLSAVTVRMRKSAGLERMLTRRMTESKKEPAQGPDEPAGASTEPLSLDVGVFYEGGDGKLYPLREGMVLNSSDNYALYLKPGKASYVYAYQVDSSQKAFKIFPNDGYAKAGNPLAAAEQWIPEGRDYLYLDENPGREEIYVFATRAPSPMLESLKTARLSDIQDAIKTMGIGGRRGTQVLSKTSGVRADSYELITRKLAAQGDFYWKLSFIHQ